MGFFNRLKKDEEVVEELTLNINELKKRINEKLNEVNKSKPKHLKIINQRLNELKKSIKLLGIANIKEEVNKALLVGVNNSRRVLINTIESRIIIKNPSTLTDFNNYLIKINKLINKAHKDFGRHGGKVSFIYKKEMSNLTTSLDNLSVDLKNVRDDIKDDLSRIDSLKLIIKLINEHNSLLSKLGELKKKLKINEDTLNNQKNKQSNLSTDLKSLRESDELRTARASQEQINELNNDLDMLKRKADVVVSNFSKALKRFSHDTTNKVLEPLLRDPLSLISENRDDFLRIKESLLKELNTGAIKLKEKQLNKAKEALSSDELLRLSDEYKSINAELTSLKSDTGAFGEKRDLEKHIDNVETSIKTLEKENYNIKADINDIKDKIKDLIERIIGKAGEVLNTNIKIK